MIKGSFISLMFPNSTGVSLTGLHIAFRFESGCGFLAWFTEAPYTDITPKIYISVISRNTELFPWK